MAGDRAVVAAGATACDLRLPLAQLAHEQRHCVVVRANVLAGGIEPAPEDGHGPDDRSEPGAWIVRPRGMPIARRLAVPIVLLVIAAFVSACGHEFPGVGASSAPQATPVASAPSAQPSSASGPLVTVETRGGDCPDGACGSTIVIEADGRVHVTAPVPAELGSVDQATFEGLTTEIAQADFPAMKSRPFTDTCPIAFDGQETIYTFNTASGVERIATCEVIVDPADPLFVAVAAVLAGVAAP